MQLVHENIQTPLTQGAKLTGYLRDNSPEMDPKRMRPALIICPGGGFKEVSKREGEPIALEFLARGLQTFVLTYTLDEPRFPKSLLELAQAVAIVRQNAAQWHVNPDQIIVGGFSIGGHIAASLADYWQDDLLKSYHFAPQDIRPNGLLLGYPVISSGKYAHRNSMLNLLGEEHIHDEAKLNQVSLEKHVSAANPPAFIWQTASDNIVMAQNTLLYAQALQDAHVSLEYHLFPAGGHSLALGTKETERDDGHGVLPQVAVWSDLFTTWVHEQINQNAD